MAKRSTVIAFALIVIAGLAWLFVARRDQAAAPAPDLRGGTLTASLRSEPASYNRYVEATAPADLMALLTQGRLVQIDRATDELQPALAESWTQSADGATYTLKLRKGVQFSDGTPFTAEDVLFTARVLYDAKVASPLASAIRVAGQPLAFSSPDPETVVVRLPAAFAPGLRLLDSIPILPRHKLEAALQSGTFNDQWKAGSPPAEVVGLGPFVLTEHVAGERLSFARNPHYWRRDANNVQLPYLDALTVAIVPDQNAEALRMESGAIDLMSNGDIRPDDYAAFKRASDAGKLRLIDVGVGLDPNLLWFNLRKQHALFHERAFRQALSHAIDRQAIVNTVYLGAAVPIYGPVTPGNKTWFSAAAPTYPYDNSRARTLLASIGLSKTDANGMLLDRESRPVRFSLLTQKGHTIRERTATVIQEHLRQIGITVDLAALDPNGIMARWQAGDYDAIYMGVQASSTDPAIGTADFWLSSGPFHFWSPGQKTPATPWEARIDELMRKQASAQTLSERQQLFAEVQKIFGDELPAIYLVAPRVTLAVSGNLQNPRPALQIPQLLWSADTLRAARH
jgi:peptide/nickel transport system substrate-binding protein